jgi:hypothetical protein
MKTKTTLAALTLITLLCAALDASAQDGSNNPLLSSDWLIRIGGQQSDADASIGLSNEELGEIPIVDLNRLGVDSEVTSLWANFLWQAPERWSVGFNYFQAEAEGSRITDEDIEFGDLVIPAGTGINAKFTTDFYVLNAYYDLFQRPDKSLGVGVGIYALDLGMALQKQVGGELTDRTEAADALAPLPTLSMYYQHAFNEHWAWMVDFSWLSANIDQYDGDVFATRIALDYWFNEHWGVGAGYTYVDLDLTIDKDVFDQLYEVQYDSMFIYATFGF